MKKLLPAWIEIFDIIKDGIIISMVAKKSDTTFSHTVKILKMLEDEKYIEIIAKGRMRCITFTAKGKRMKEKIKEFIEKNNKLLGRIRLLNRLKECCKDQGMKAPDFKGLSQKELEIRVSKLLKTNKYK